MESTNVVIVSNQPQIHWQNGLFDFREECSFCALAFFCPSVTYGKTKKKMGEEFQSHCCLYFSLQFVLPTFFGLPFINICLARSNREMLRKRYGIDGGHLEDCAVHLLCDSCAQTQEFLQLKKVPFRQTIAISNIGPTQNIVIHK